MEFRRRARLFERKSSFLDRLKKKRNEVESSQVMKVKTKAGHIKEVNSNGVEIIRNDGHYDYQENSRKHRQVLGAESDIIIFTSFQH
jgi:hypothetical protein